jgi:hypothetical protein
MLSAESSSMARGGARRGAGRPRGTRNKTKPKPRLPKFDPASRSALLAYCREVVESGRVSEVLDSALSSDDSAERRWAVTFAASYALGTPTAHLKVEQAKSFAQVLEEWDRERALLPPPPPEPPPDPEDDEADA